MKKFKKLASLLLVAMMVLAMAIPAMAETVTITDSEKVTLNNHQFAAYQIFSGTQQDTTGIKLGDVKWGTGVKENILEALSEITEFNECTTAQDVAEVLETKISDTVFVNKFIDAVMAVDEGKYTYLQSPKTVGNDSVISAAGYYLFIDITKDVGEGGVYNAALLQVTGESDNNLEITVKTDKPSSQKKVKDISDSVDAPEETGWQDSADYDIGDDVPFQLTGTLPNNVDKYDTYMVTFHDAQSKGLSFDANSVVVKVGNDIVDNQDGSKYKVVTEGLTDGCAFEIQIPDVKVLGATNGSVITVEYKSKLTGAAVKFGVPGNPNEMYMEYSNNPNVGGEGKTGTTPKDKVVVFTYKTSVDKIDEKFNPLAGAEFTLYKYDPTNKEAIKDEDSPYKDYVKKNMVKVGDEGKETSFKFEGLDDGKYILVETVTPAGYNTAADIEFTVSAEHDTEKDDPQLTELKVDNKSFTASKDGTIQATKQNKEPKALTAGEIYTEVVNNAGVELPETGGIGTTIFYVLGSILVLGAVIVLVTKKRMSVEK